jgi:NAD(P)-dependent dehydrogenase (short-subunit alcohol dehydrogenase family)
MTGFAPVAVVTGAAQGIGFATAELIASNGAFVLLVDNNEEQLLRSTTLLRDRGLDVSADVVDVSDRNAVSNSIAHLVEEKGGIDWLVNNAGVAVFGDPADITDDDWRRCMAIDLDGVWNFCQAAFPFLKVGANAAIVNVASVHSHKIIRSTFPYPVAKHAVVGLTRSLAIEYARDQVRVNAVCPGYVDTPLTRAHFAAQDNPEGERARIEQLHPLGRLASESDIASAISFLLSPASAYITGVSLLVDGGRSLIYHD